MAKARKEKFYGYFILKDGPKILPMYGEYISGYYVDHRDTHLWCATDPDSGSIVAKQGTKKELFAELKSDSFIERMNKIKESDTYKQRVAEFTKMKYDACIYVTLTH